MPSRRVSCEIQARDRIHNSKVVIFYPLPLQEYEKNCTKRQARWETEGKGGTFTAWNQGRREQ